jgi:ABC exporter DevB family membrane fusion protein
MVKSAFFVKPRGWITSVTVITVAILTGSSATYFLLRFRGNSPAPAAIYSPSKISPTAISARGYLEPKGEVIKISASAFMEGTRVAKLLVKQGDNLKNGQIIAILDNHERLQAALTQAEAQRKISEARLAQVKAGAKQGDVAAQDARFQKTRAELRGQIATQQATIASLEAELQGETSARKATIERIRAELINAQTDCRRYQTLYLDGAVPEQERDRFCLQAETIAKSLQEAEANLNRIERTMKQRIQEAKANLDRTRTTLAQEIKANQAALEAVAEVRPVDVQVAEAQLISDQALVKRARAELNLAYVKAPKSGQILKIRTWPGEVVGNEGIVDLGETGEMYVRAEVYETDIQRVRVGQTATIRSDGLAGELTGVVSEIGLQVGRQNVLGTDPVADADARVVEVKIRLTPESSAQVSGLSNLEVTVVIEDSNAQNQGETK